MEIPTIEATAVAFKTELSINTLSYALKQRFAVLNGIYDDDNITLTLVALLEPRGENSYGKVSAKIQSIIQADYVTQQYHDVLYDSFQIGATYSDNDVMSIVGAVRRDLNLMPYLAGIKKNSLRDLLSLFITKGVANTYTPLFKLKPED